MERKPWRRRIGRSFALTAGFGALLLFLADCGGCGKREKESIDTSAAPAAGAKAAGGAKPRHVRPPRPPNALDKISAAEAAGRLDLDTAWSYRMLALFDPAQLPEEYRSREGIRCASPALDDLAAVRDRLRPETRANIRPYLLRPTHPESFFAKNIRPKAARRRLPGGGLLYAQEDVLPQRPSKDRSAGDWIGHECGSAPITVWAAGDEDAAYAAVGAIDGRNFWARFKKIMPFEPVSDEFAVDEQGRPDSDIDGTLDIYLAPAGRLATKDGQFSGMCVGLGTTTRMPTWIMIDQELRGLDLEAILAHEIFHSFQYALDAYEEKWWKEATADWAEEYIDVNYSTDEYVPDAFDGQKFLLKTINADDLDQMYAAYIFPSYMAGRFGDAFIGEIWTDCSVDGANALQAIENRLSGAGLELKEAWKEFALMNYDDAKEYGRKYKEVLNTWNCHAEDTILLKEKSDVQDIELPPLSAFYFVVTDGGIDADRFPGVHIDLAELKEKENVSVQAVILKDGDFRVEDWTDREERDFCLKNESDRFDEIDIIVASSEREETLTGLKVPVELGFIAECDVDWAGTLTFTAEYGCDDSKEGEWRKSGAWRAGTSGPWEDQFKRFDTVQKNSFRATATVDLKLKSQVNKAGSEEEKEMLEGLNRLFGGAVYSQEGVTGTCGISYHRYSKETTTIRPPGSSYDVSSDSQASGGGALSRYGMSALPGPRLNLYPEKGEYSLEIDFSAPEVPGTTTIASSGGGEKTSRWTWDGGKPLFSSYQWRTGWAEPALKGKYDGSSIVGQWKSPPRKRPEDGSCQSPGVEVADITVSWSLHKVR